MAHQNKTHLIRGAFCFARTESRTHPQNAVLRRVRICAAERPTVLARGGGKAQDIARLCRTNSRTFVAHQMVCSFFARTGITNPPSRRLGVRIPPQAVSCVTRRTKVKHLSEPTRTPLCLIRVANSRTSRRRTRRPPSASLYQKRQGARYPAALPHKFPKISDTPLGVSCFSFFLYFRCVDSAAPHLLTHIAKCAMIKTPKNTAAFRCLRLICATKCSIIKSSKSKYAR